MENSPRRHSKFRLRGFSYNVLIITITKNNKNIKNFPTPSPNLRKENEAPHQFHLLACGPPDGVAESTIFHVCSIHATAYSPGYRPGYFFIFRQRVVRSQPSSWAAWVRFPPQFCNALRIKSFSFPADIFIRGFRS